MNVGQQTARTDEGTESMDAVDEMDRTKAPQQLKLDDPGPMDERTLAVLALLIRAIDDGSKCSGRGPGENNISW